MKRIITAATFFVLAGNGVSQAAPGAAEQLRADIGDLSTVGPAPRAAPLEGGLDLTAGMDDSSVSLRAVSVDSVPGSPDMFTSLSLTLKAPLDESSVHTELANLSGFANSTSFEVKFSNVEVRGRRHPTKADLDVVCLPARANPPEGMDGKKDSCRALVGPNWNDLFWQPNANAFFYGGAAKVGYKRFDFNDATTLAESHDSKTPWSVSAYVALYPRGPQRLITLSVEHVDTWKDADTKTLCPAGTAPVVCIQGALGGPVHKKSDLISLEIRQKFAAFAVAPLVTYDAKDDIWGIEAPIYLITDAKGGLSGGVKFGWRSDDDDLRVGVFVSKPFSVLTF